jgi:hypothetical protein
LGCLQTGGSRIKKKADLILAKADNVDVDFVLLELFGNTNHIFFVGIDWRPDKYNDSATVIFTLPVL